MSLFASDLALKGFDHVKSIHGVYNATLSANSVTLVGAFFIFYTFLLSLDSIYGSKKNATC